MKLGLSLPTAGEFASTGAIVRIAEGAEQLGLDSVWTFERQLSPTGEIEALGGRMTMPEIYSTVYSPLEVLAFVAARTSRVRLGTSVVVALLHHPVALARSYATLDQLSDGRVVVGLGQGWLQHEFDAAERPRRRQGAGFAEFIEAMRAVWAPDPVSFEGRFYRFAPSNVNPKPVQPGGPPVLVGAGTPASVQRTARMGLGLNPIWFGWEHLEGMVGLFRAAAQESGRDPDGLPVVVRVNDTLKRAPVDGEASLVGSPEQVAEALDRAERLGVTEVLWSPMRSDAGEDPIEGQLDLTGRLVKLLGRA